MTQSKSKLMMARLPDNVAQLIKLISERNPTHRKHLESTLPDILSDELLHLEKYLDFCTRQGLTLDYLADCYLVLVADSVNELIYFERNQKYRYATFEEVADQVYFNDEYMNQYMHGLAISLIFWNSHRQTHRFFARHLPRDRAGTYFEIGPGHGTFLMTAMQHSDYDNFFGVDISATSIAQTRSILEHFFPAAGDQYSLVVEDFFNTRRTPGSCDAVVMGEVLEHVENPGLFLEKIYELAKDDAFIFVTTCVNAPQIDHIYLFRTVDEVRNLIGSNNFRIVESCEIPYTGKTLEQCAAQRLPVNVAYILEKSS